jgi:hypothetical protein
MNCVPKVKPEGKNGGKYFDEKTGCYGIFRQTLSLDFLVAPKIFFHDENEIVHLHPAGNCEIRIRNRRSQLRESSETKNADFPGILDPQLVIQILRSPKKIFFDLSQRVIS